MQQYQLSQFTDELRGKLLKLAGIQRRPASPAVCAVYLPDSGPARPALSRLTTSEGVPFELEWPVPERMPRIEHESREEKRSVYSVDLPLRARALSDITSKLFPSGMELNLELGSHRYKNYLEADSSVCLCRDEETLLAYCRRRDALEQHLLGRDIPIYLAKLELINSAGGVFLGGVTNLPFGQSVRQSRESRSSIGGDLTVTTSVHSLEYWQKPDVRAAYQQSGRSLHFNFGIPSPEQYDYAVAHGAVDLTMPSGIRVNTRVFSEEIAHGLGTGAVDIRLSVEFLDDQEPALLYGNSEVFKGKGVSISPP